MNFKQTQKVEALRMEYRKQLINKASDMFDIVMEVGKTLNEGAVNAGSGIVVDRAEAYKLVELALRAEEIAALSRIEKSVDNV